MLLFMRQPALLFRILQQLLHILLGAFGVYVFAVIGWQNLVLSGAGVCMIDA